jgi:hypothetical protein
MNRNGKIALGCGGAGCLGLIFLAIVGAAVYLYMQSGTRNTNRNYNFNVSTNRNSNSNSSNSNNNTNSLSNSDSSMSDDDKHKLYHAATLTGDPQLLRRVSIKLGLMNSDFTPSDEYVAFVQEHVSWSLQNTDFIQSLNSKEKAIAYVNDHFDD